MTLRRSLYARPVIVRGQQCTAVHLLRFGLSAGDAEAFLLSGCGLSAICQHTCLAMPCVAGCRLDSSVPTSWDDVVQSVVLESVIWGPHSLHTAEATGSKPVTPTSTNSLLTLRRDAGCQQIASKPP
jgi:hypothetical protein